MRKRIVCCILIVLLLVAFSASAYGHSGIDMGRMGSLSIAMTYKGEAVPGGEVSIFRVAEIMYDNGDYSFGYVHDFSGCSIPVTELNSDELPQELARIAREQGIKGISMELDENGAALFENLELGLYLVVQTKAAPGFYAINPFLVSVPGYDGSSYYYAVDASPKLEADPVPVPTPTPTPPVTPTPTPPVTPTPTPPVTETPTPPVTPTPTPTPPVTPTPPQPSTPVNPPPPQLPQTGQTNWPMPVMAVAGLMLFCGGWMLRASDRKKNDEK